MSAPAELGIARIRAMTPEEKLRVAHGLWEDAWALTRAAIAARHPHWSSDAVLDETRRVMSGERLP